MMFKWLREKLMTWSGAMLTGAKIKEEISSGAIRVSEFDESKLNPNSYNISTGSYVKMYQDITIIDLKDPDTYKHVTEIKIPEEGMVLRPGNLYLIPTREIIETDRYIPLITGRSSIGRLGITVHQEAGFGDIGYKGVWTLQVRVTYPTRIYPNLPIAQVYFLTPSGRAAVKYHGRYQGSMYSVSSRWTA